MKLYRPVLTKNRDTVAPQILGIPEISAERHSQLAATTSFQDSGSILQDTSLNPYTKLDVYIVQT